MDFNLPSILTDAQVATFAATIGLLVGILQTVSFIPMPEGSRARAVATAILAGVFVALHAPLSGHSGTQLILAVILSYAALGGAALGLNRAGSYTAQVIADRASEPTVTDYDPKAPPQP